MTEMRPHCVPQLEAPIDLQHQQVMRQVVAEWIKRRPYTMPGLKGLSATIAAPTGAGVGREERILIASCPSRGPLTPLRYAAEELVE